MTMTTAVAEFVDIAKTYRAPLLSKATVFALRGISFTIEPGVYIPEEQIGVRIEDVFYVDQDGRLVDLIAKLPHETPEVEAAMRH